MSGRFTARVPKLLLSSLALFFASVATAAAASPRLVFTQTLTQQDRFVPPPSYLCAADPDGAHQSRASASAYPFLAQSDYSRDGSHVTYVRGFEGGGEIQVANADGSNARTISTVGPAEWPRWLPDGSAVVYERHVGNAPLFETRLELATLGGPTYELTSGHHDIAPAVSPDDRHIVFASERASGNINALDLFSYDLVTGQITQLTDTPATSETQPSFSPDGSQLVLAAGPPVSGLDSRLVVMRATGGPETPLTSEPDDNHPRWSPDGSLIAFERNHDVWTVRPDGSALRNVTGSPVTESDPAWQPAGATPSGGTGSCAIVGTPGNDVLTGTPGADFFYDVGGNDVLNGLGGNDVIVDGPGNDTVHGGTGSDTIVLGPGRNTAYGDSGNDTVTASGTAFPGRTFAPSTLPQRIYGSTGNEIVYGSSAADVIDGGSGNDKLSAAGGNDLVTGGNDDDTLYGGRGADRILAGAGNDIVWGDPPAKRDGAADLIEGGPGRDQLHGGWGNDTLRAADDRTSDRVDGGGGTDRASWDRGLDSVTLVERRIG